MELVTPRTFIKPTTIELPIELKRLTFCIFKKDLIPPFKCKNDLNQNLESENNFDVTLHKNVNQGQITNAWNKNQTDSSPKSKTNCTKKMNQLISKRK